MKVTYDIAEDIIKHHLGKAPKEVREVPGGLANFVFLVTMDSEKFIVRIAEEQERLQFFLKEQWAVQKAREEGVPVPEILEVGNEASIFPYMVVRWIEGKTVEQSSNREQIVKEMGKYGAIINSIKTSGFGHVFDWSSNQLSRNDTWKGYLENELDVAGRLAVFEKYKILPENRMAALKSAIREVREWNYKPTLNHGDLRLKNLILDDKGKIIAILDWENALSTVAPHWDVSIAIHDLTLDERDIFLSGYGLSGQEYRRIAKGIKVFNILNYAPFVLLANEEKSDTKRKFWMESIKTRLRGGFDLYSI